jgi:hypothetical protein
MKDCAGISDWRARTWTVVTIDGQRLKLNAVLRLAGVEGAQSETRRQPRRHQETSPSTIAAAKEQIEQHKEIQIEPVDRVA